MACPIVAFVNVYGMNEQSHLIYSPLILLMRKLGQFKVITYLSSVTQLFYSLSWFVELPVEVQKGRIVQEKKM